MTYSMTTRCYFSAYLLLLACSLVSAGCNQQSDAPKGQGTGAPPTVTVVKPQKNHTITKYVEQPGMIRGYAEALTLPVPPPPRATRTIAMMTRTRSRKNMSSARP